MDQKIYELIVEHIDDEVDDVICYKELMELTTGYTHEVLCNIIKDEESHARYLVLALKHAGRKPPNDIYDKYCNMEDSFRKG